MSGVLVVGSVNADLVFRVSQFPAPGETVSAESFQTLAGGKGANQAVACARVGEDVRLCGCFGSDTLADFLWNAVSTWGVDLRHSIRTDQSSGSAAVFVNAEGENQIVIAPGANALVSAEQVVQAVSNDPADVLLAQLEIPEAAVMAAAQSGRRLILNPAPYRSLPVALLEGLFAITPNELEMTALCGIAPSTDEGMRAGAARLLDRGVRNVVVTLGAQGCYWTDGAQELQVAALPVSPVDTTGAGDVFNGVLAARIAAGDSFGEGLRWASAAASVSTTRLGAMNSSPSRETVAAALAD